MSVTISVVCFKSKILANGEYPLMLRITQDRKRVMKSLKISVNPKYWDFTKGEPKPKCPNRELIQNIILKVKAKYQNKVLEKLSKEEEFTDHTEILRDFGIMHGSLVKSRGNDLNIMCPMDRKG